MWLGIAGQGVEVNGPMRGRVERRLRFALARFGHRVGRVAVQLADVTGPRGGADKRCRIVADMPGTRSAPVVVEEDGDDWNAVIDRAAEQVGRTVRRRLELARLFAHLIHPRHPGSN